MPNPLAFEKYMWNLEKWYLGSYLQSRSRDTDEENKYIDTKVGKEKWDELRQTDIHTMYKPDN